MPSDALRSAARLSVAPMMEWTDRHCRVFHRQLSREALLYTEMVTAPALVRGGALHLLDHDAAEHPLALQLGGSDPEELAEAARLGEEAGYDEINLNCGCPSDRVQSGTFGAVLMRDPALVARGVAAMRRAVSVPVTVKCRIGVDDQEPAEVLPAFLEAVAEAGATRLIVHARKAWLQGLSPKENRDIPPLDYELVMEMKRRFPELHLSINGGITSLEQARGFLEAGLDGVMVGRAAYHQPWDVLAGADAEIYGADRAPVAPEEAARGMLDYIDAHVASGGKVHQVTRHMLGLFAGRPGARIWRRVLSENATKPGMDSGLVLRALDEMTAARAAA
ncbi:tRNA dihydrouridine(20/20a) synthase DusA [Roseivivax sp. GX 12232]|uniref:tRNA dihydrouridine(20/20a) synthase DusA n=1 Tax=Roseivivax sp. GX 12232 TaxID=2900547 RepID=UPI001E579D2D|nr:tRNA dihydrouridine(20/20a) synthase DusA [Roseivivax sp. GX 12232]MCE0504772.1 tRNA dihydrouridine(20/20a) synthase DusA [Roseivivax sp. GX 12232]